MERKKIRIFKTEGIGFGFFILLSALILGCQNETALTANQIMERTVQTHGGLDTWKNIEQLSFDKKVTLFLEDGATERQTNQFQLFQFQEAFGKIEWEENNTDHQIIFESGKITKREQDSLLVDPNAIDRAKRAFFASEYVIKQPFDLLHDDVILSKQNDTIINEHPCYIIGVAYKDEPQDADRWHYIIDKETYTIVANKIVLKDHSSWVENLTFDTTTDFKFNAHRKSYRLNEKGKKTYLRAEYFYENYNVSY